MYHSVIFRARVVARDPDGKDYETETNSEGVYSFDVPAGIYKVEANAEGFCSKRIDNFKFTTGCWILCCGAEDNKPCNSEACSNSHHQTDRLTLSEG